MPKSVADVLQMAANVKMVDLRFTDLPGVWQHFTIPAHVLEETRSRTASRSMGLRSAASKRSTSRTCC